MELLLHVGMRKTGSTFLQTQCYHNREMLRNKGIYFPVPNEIAKKLQFGKLNPGNAEKLYETIRKAEFTDAIEFVSKTIKEAENENCKKILLSNEKLFIALSNTDSSYFLESLNRIGIYKLKIILFVRDPIDHALSLYKHINKTGRVPSFEHWLNGKYQSFEMVNAFLEKVVFSETTIKKYGSKPIEKLFFDEWLKIRDYKVYTGKVNRSITISEVHYLQYLRKKNLSDLAGFIFQDFLNLDKSKKCNDKLLEHVYRRLIEQKMQDFDFETINKYIFKEPIKVLKKGNEKVEIKNGILFSETQMSIVHKNIYFMNSVYGRIRYFLRRNNWMLLKVRKVKKIVGLS
jgi:hypothetical protein